MLQFDVLEVIYSVVLISDPRILPRTPHIFTNIRQYGFST